MSSKILTYEIVVEDKDGNIESVTKELNTLVNMEETIVDLNKKISETPIDTKEFKNLTKQLKQVESQYEGAKIKSKGFTDSLADSPGIMGQVGKGIKGVNTAFKAMLANPIVLFITLLVGALTAVYKAFASTKDGAEKIEQVMAGVSATIDVVRDRFLLFVKALSSFSLSGMIDAFRGMGEEIKEEAFKAAELKRELQGIIDTERDLNKERALQNRLISEAKKKINDETLSYDERIAALKEVAAKERALAVEEENLARRKYNAVKAQNALSDSSKEDLDAEAAAYIALQNAMKNTADKQKEVADQTKSLNDRRKAERKQRQAERVAGEKSYNDMLEKFALNQIETGKEKDMRIADNERKANIESINALKISSKKKNQLLLENEEDFKTKQAEITKKYDDEAEKEQEVKDTEKRDALLTKYDNELQLLENAQVQEFDLIKKNLEDKKNLLLQNDKLTAEERKIIEQDYANSILAINQTITDQKEEGLVRDAEIEAAKLQLKLDTLDQATQLAGSETALGKALILAKELLLAKEFIISAKKQILASKEAVTSATLTGAEAGTEVAGSVAKATNTAPPPFNIPFILTAIATGASVISAVKAAISATKKAAGQGGGGSGGSGGAGQTGGRFALGGLVEGPGTGQSDSIPALLSSGESVINSRSTQMFGPMLSSMNQLGGGKSFSSSGVIGGAESRLSNAIGNTPIQTYVVASEVTSVQQMERQVQDRSAL